MARKAERNPTPGCADASPAAPSTPALTDAEVRALHNTTFGGVVLTDWCRCPVCRPELHDYNDTAAAHKKAR